MAFLGWRGRAIDPPAAPAAGWGKLETIDHQPTDPGRIIMRLSLRSVAIATIAAAGIGAGFFAMPASADEKLALVERAASDTVIDTGAAGDSAGDLLTFANEIYDAANAKLVGHDNGMCIRTAVGEAWECIWTVTLEGGQITVEGPYYDTKDSTLAITGGTGEYAATRGDMLLHARNEQGTEYDFVYAIKD
jgi:Allene oxide cyclase